MKKDFIVVIPARGGSKGVKDKNIKLLDGHPLIFYSIYVASKLKNIRTFLITTDSNKIIKTVWDSLTYLIVGNSSSKKRELVKTINGITVSPKKNFCILKIWLKTTDHQNPEEITSFSGFTSEGCLFKRHTPEY